MVRKSWYSICLILGLAISAHAQGVSVSGQAIVNTQVSMPGIPGNVVLQAVPNAQITVCASTGGGIPCSPLVTIYSNAALSVIAPNPFTADLNGNFQFYVPPLSTGYIYSQTGSGVVGQLFVISPASLGGGISILPTDNIFTNNNRFAGPDPWVDITASGARYFPGGTPSGTVTCTSGSPNIVDVTNLHASWGGPTGLRPGDGLTIYGCGPNVQVTTPTGLTVTPSGTWGPAETQAPITTATGSSTYAYKVIAEDINGGLSAPTAAVTITTGFASLGLQQATINTLSRTNDRVTVTLTGAPAQPLVVDELVEIIPTAGSQFYGWFNIAQVDSSTQFEVWTTGIDTRAQGWMVGDIMTASGGTVNFYRNNYLLWTPTANAWNYSICGKRPGDSNFHLIGRTRPTGLDGIAYIDASFEDYGSPYEDFKNYPVYLQSTAEAAFNNNPTNIAAQTTSNAICTASSPLNDELTGTIVSSPDGGTTVVMSVNASNTVLNPPTAIWTWDNAPGIRAALASATSNSQKGTIYIPPAGQFGFIINSPIVVPTQVTILQSGRLTLNEPFILQGSVNWIGNWGNSGQGGFSTNQGAPINAINANPTIYAHGAANVLYGLSIQSSAVNGGVGFVNDSGEANFDNVNFSGSGSNSTDYDSFAFIERGIGSAQQIFFRNVNFSGGPNQVSGKSRTPLVWVAPGQNGLAVAMTLMFDNVTDTSRGFVFGGGGNTGVFGNTATCPVGFVHFKIKYRQAGIMPVFTTMQCGSSASFEYEDIFQDTEGQPLHVNLTKFPANDSVGPKIEAFDVGGGAGNPLATGSRGAANIKGNFANAKSFQNRDMSYDSGGLLSLVTSPYQTSGTFATAISPLYTIAKPMHVPGGYQLWFDSVPPSSVTVSATAGGAMPPGTFVYAVSMAGYNNGETILSIPSGTITVPGTCPGSGNCSVTANWTNPLGSYSSNVWRCPTTGTCTNADGTLGGGPWFRVALHVAGSSFIDTIASPTQFTTPQASGTGATVIDNTGISAPVFKQISNGQASNLGQIIASGATALNSGSAITSGSCSTIITVASTGALTTDNLSADFNSDPSGVTGYGVNASGTLTIYKWITAGNVNFKQCNSTGGSITPAAATVQWRVLR